MNQPVFNRIYPASFLPLPQEPASTKKFLNRTVLTQRYACITHLGERGTPEAVATHANYPSLFTSSSQNPRG